MMSVRLLPRSACEALFVGRAPVIEIILALDRIQFPAPGRFPGRRGFTRMRLARTAAQAGGRRYSLRHEPARAQT